MKSSNREEIVDHDAKGLFDIVLDIESYPYFIPWCSAMRIHSKNKNLIIKNDQQNPIAIQVGGSDPLDLSKCSDIAKSLNYDEINLNVGCPSKAVQKGSFGACLMKDKHLVRRCIESMQKNNIES